MISAYHRAKISAIKIIGRRININSNNLAIIDNHNQENNIYNNNNDLINKLDNINDNYQCENNQTEKDLQRC